MKKRTTITIRIIQSINDKAEIIVSNTEHIHILPIENKRLVSNTLLVEFYKEWKLFYFQSQQLKNQSPNDKSVDREIVSNLKKKGKALTSILFGTEISIRTSDDVEIFLFSLDKEYANLPYEILMFKEKFICEISSIIRQIRDIQPKIEKINQQPNDGLLIFNPNHSKDIQELVNDERTALEELFEKDKISNWKTLNSKFLHQTNFLEEIHNKRYLHFAGHSDASGIPLANNGKLDASQFSNLNLTNLDIVFFNSCYSSFQNNNKDSIVQAFIKSGTKNFVGFNLPVSNHVALFISLYFWKEILNKQPIHRIIYNIRKSIREKFGDGEISWVIINHFGLIQLNGNGTTRWLKVSIFIIILFFVVALSFSMITKWDTIKFDDTISQVKIETLKKKKHFSKRKYKKNFIHVKENTVENKVTVIHNINKKNISSKFSKEIDKFMATPHPFYSKEQKEAFILQLLNEPMTEKMMMIKLKNEIP